MFVQAGASWPPMAPSTIVTRGFRLGSRLARAVKLLVPLEAHSWVVFDIPLEISTIAPFGRRKAIGVQRLNLFARNLQADGFVRGGPGVCAIWVKSANEVCLVNAPAEIRQRRQTQISQRAISSY